VTQGGPVADLKILEIKAIPGDVPGILYATGEVLNKSSRISKVHFILFSHQIQKIVKNLILHLILF